jgi:hypothetical protein
LAFDEHQEYLRSIHANSGTITQWKITTASRLAENINNHQRDTSMKGIDVSGPVTWLAIVLVVVIAIGIARQVMRSNDKKRKKDARKL